MKSFEELQADLGYVWQLNQPPGSGVEHVLVVLPSFSIGESLLSHYAPRIPALEHRYLVAHLFLHRVPSCEIVFLSCEAPGKEVIDYYTSLVPEECRASVRDRFRSVVVPDRTARSVAAKLRGRPELLDTVRASFQGRPAFIDPWNVTSHEVEVAWRLQAPLNGSAPDLWPLGYKSSGRRLFRETGVPLPYGREDIRTVDDIVAAAMAILEERPTAPAIVVKLDDSGAGDGNVLIDLRDVGLGRVAEERIRAAAQELPDWYLGVLTAGGIVEELVAGTTFSSPSVQMNISPHGQLTVLSTHEQVLGGESGQVYTGCRFPADPAYAAELARYGRAVGERLAERGAIGRFGMDFAVVRDEAGRPRVFALEINLRKGGTTHPYDVLHNLVRGEYNPDLGVWLAVDGSTRYYCATDNLVDGAWLGLPPATVIKAVADAGLQFDPRTGTGVVLHMLSCLAIDGRMGLTAIGRTREHAAELYDATRSAVDRSV
jgi:hypothetical protein